MSKLDDLLDDFYSDERFLNKKSMQSKTYTDQPILKRASALPNYTPPKIAEMRALAEGQSSYNWSSPRLFVRQGRLMADYEDDFAYSGTFFRYYPTYQLMSDVQLRGYFSWRTKVRRGQVEPIALSFVFVYLYELLNLIGVSSPEEGYEKLVWFRDAYAPIDGSVAHYLKDWLVDFAACYGLDPALIRDEEALRPYKQYTVLSRWKTHTADELFGAICGLSSYNVEKSKFYKAYPEDTKAVLCRVFADFSQHHADKCKNSLCERLFGRVHTLPYTMFSSAVAALDRDRPDCDYEIFPWYGYACRNGVWYRTRLDRNPAKNRKLGELTRDVDAILRERYGFDAPLKATDKTKLFTGIVNNAIDALLEEKRRKAAAVVHIDVSKLAAIRSDASETREKLMTEEEREDIKSPVASHQSSECGMRNAECGIDDGSAAPQCRCEGKQASETDRAEPLESGNTGSEVGSRKSEVSPAGNESGSKDSERQISQSAVPDTPANDLPLDETETAVLRAILNGADAMAAAKAAGRMLSVVVDAINEKLFDLFGDAVIFDDGDAPAVYDDYAEELKGMTGI